MSKVQDLAEKHWSYVEQVVRSLGASEREVEIAKVQYITAFIHGHKHAKEDGGSVVINNSPFFSPPNPILYGSSHGQSVGSCLRHITDGPILNNTATSNRLLSVADKNERQLSANQAKDQA